MVMDKFYFNDGSSAGSLEGFLDRLRDIDDGCFGHHVNDERNDFTGWIAVCVGDKTLARRISKMKERKKIIASIEKRLHPVHDKKGIIEQIKEAILGDE